jgi:hypothetical protein
LFTLQSLGLLSVVASKYRLLAPRSLREVLREELSEAEERVKEGLSVMGAGGTGLSFQSVPAGDPGLIAERDARRELLTWADANITFQPRPMEAFGATNTLGTDEQRAQLGESSSDTLELARHGQATIYADDLGLRRLSDAFGVSSFSTLPLLESLAETGALPPGQRDKLLVDLAEMNFTVLSVSPELLLEAAKPTRPPRARQLVFGLLAAPSMSAVTAAQLLVRSVKLAASRGVVVSTPTEIVNYGLEVMASRFPAPTCALLVSRLALDELSLLPTDLADVRRACATFCDSTQEQCAARGS